MFFVTFVHVLPPSRVTCTWPSLVPAQMRRFSFGDSVIAITTGNYSTPMLSAVTTTRSLKQWCVLSFTWYVIRNVVVDGHVVHLRDRQLDAAPGAAAIDRDSHAAVVRHRHAVRVGRIDPHVVIVAAGIRSALLHR